jgi:hypothetical protein
MLDKSTELGCGSVGRPRNGLPQWRLNLVAQETSPIFGHPGPNQVEPMPHRVLSLAHGLFAALWLLTAALVLRSPSLAQSPDGKAPDKPAPPAQDQVHKVDEYAEAQRMIAGPAGNPECVWAGRRVVSLLWRDDIETAFRHLDLYDRFGCPAGHIQAAFRCLLAHAASIDPKATDSLNGRVQACWINPTQPPPPTPSAATTSPTTNH